MPGPICQTDSAGWGGSGDVAALALMRVSLDLALRSQHLMRRQSKKVGVSGIRDKGARRPSQHRDSVPCLASPPWWACGYRGGAKRGEKKKKEDGHDFNARCAVPRLHRGGRKHIGRIKGLVIKKKGSETQIGLAYLVACP